jgi:hypothetical protein
MKHLNKFYNIRDIPWVNLIWNSYYQDGEIPHATKEKGSFWWKDILKLCETFRGIATCRVGNGTGLTFGTITYCRTNFHSCSHLQKTKKFSGLVPHKQQNRGAVPPTSINPSFSGIATNARID